MGVDYTAYLVYGIAISDDIELPWSGEKHDGDEEDWWACEVHGYKPSVELYDEHGEYLPGTEGNQEMKDKFYQEWRDEKEAHPFPVDVRWTGTYDTPSFIITLPALKFESYWGSPEKVEDLTVLTKDDKIIRAFVKKYIPEEKSEPAWYLTGIYG